MTRQSTLDRRAGAFGYIAVEKPLEKINSTANNAFLERLSRTKAEDAIRADVSESAMIIPSADGSIFSTGT